jgi:hypothetical protein
MCVAPSGRAADFDAVHEAAWEAFAAGDFAVAVSPLLRAPAHPAARTTTKPMLHALRMLFRTLRARVHFPENPLYAMNAPRPRKRE